MRKVKYFILPTKRHKDKYIYIRFSNGRKFDIRMKTPYVINSKYWNDKTCKVHIWNEYPEALQMQEDLNNLEKHIINEYDIIKNDEVINKKWLEETIDKKFNPDKYLSTETLFGFIENFINESENDPKKAKITKKATRYVYKRTFDLLKEYAGKYGEPDFKDVDAIYLENFDVFLENEKGFSKNTIMKYIKTLKRFLNDANEKGISNYKKYKKFTVRFEDSDNIYLTETEINKLYNYDLSHKPSLEKVKDLFIVGCWTGLRFSDLRQITQDKIKDDFIEIKQKKTNKEVIIPIHKTVKELLKKYNGKLPKPISNQKFNKYLKEVAKLAGIDEPFKKTTYYYSKEITKEYKKYEIISSHTARRSFCTNAYEKKIPIVTIMAISGHKTETQFLKYIKTTSREHAEKMLEYWKSEKNHLQVV